MDQTIGEEKLPQTDAEYEAALEHMLAQMRRMNEQMDRDRRDIERLRAESQALRARGQRRDAEIGASLDRLNALVSSLSRCWSLLESSSGCRA